MDRMERSMSLPPGQSMRDAAARCGTASSSNWRTRGWAMTSSQSLPNRSSQHRRNAGVRRSWDGDGSEDILPPLSKGALRHRVPSSQILQSKMRVVEPSARDHLDLEAAEAFGRKILGEDSWTFRLFEESDGANCGYLWPAEFAALGFRFEQAMEGFHGKFKWSFQIADANREGRVSFKEWERFCGTLVAIFGNTRCRIAAQRVLGSRKAERETKARRKVKNVYIFDGFDADASIRLLDLCSKGYKNSNLVEQVQSALGARADPNTGLAVPTFNDYTPLMFLCLTRPGPNSSQVAAAIRVLVEAGADVHRECGQMPTGRLVPLRFAARLQNQQCLQALRRYIDLGDVFHWAAGENAPDLMLTELERIYGSEIAKHVSKLNGFSNNASALLRIFASPIVGGSLTADGAEDLCEGKYDDGFIRPGDRADPNSPGLEGRTALMQMCIDGSEDVVEALLAGRADLHQRDSSGATPLHHAACQAQHSIVRMLIAGGAELHSVDHAGFSPWMLVGESRCFQHGPDGRSVACAERDITAAAGDVKETLELLRPEFSPEELLDLAEESPEALLATLEGHSVTLEVMEQRFRLQESLWFSPRMATKGAFQGREARQHLLLRLSKVMIQLLQTDPLEGDKKLLAKYLLQATKGPDARAACGHVHVPWEEKDNRVPYRLPLMEAVKEQLGFYADACNQLRGKIDKAAASADRDAEPDEISLACQELLRLPSDEVQIPESWMQTDPFWKAVQDRQVLRYEPSWARSISDGASCCLQLLRLGVPADKAEASKLRQKPDACAVTCLTAYSGLRQVQHAKMQELFGRGYVTYSNLCNKPFQDKMKQIAARARDAGADVGMPDKLVGAKRLPRIMEKTNDARIERAGWEWPGRRSELNHCFYILDTVRMGFSCRGDTVPEQVRCCMRLLDEFAKCTPEADGVCLLRKKSGFAAGVKGDGGYADVKLLVFADLGVHTAFDGTEIPLQIVGEVQLILESYEKVKHRMHLVYEVNRGSFDRKDWAIYSCVDCQKAMLEKDARFVDKQWHCLPCASLGSQ
eukprot:TRINITY_DN61693_c0_g1_i1.p1 TRINITY_DN61693_c0_g1~~TRINITY_DN61693_c0_g1_i1.p1  ORF type:complete len:1040 (+),score=209.01 TRINITY_DN61693_c0_g1_i1:29-3148(+)